MYIIGHRYFNKSLTLDIENKLLQYLLSSESVKNVSNRRGNPQNDIILQILSNLSQNLEGQLILVEGEAGSGKTVLMSSLLYELFNSDKLPIPQSLIKNFYTLLPYQLCHFPKEIIP